MCLSVAVVVELARAYGVALPGELVSALGRIEVADASPVTPVTLGGAAGLAAFVAALQGRRGGAVATAAMPSKGALRTRKWRERKRLVALSSSGAGSSADARDAHPMDGAVGIPASRRASIAPTATPVAACDAVTESASQNVTSVTPVTVAGQKEKSPHTPLKEKTKKQTKSGWRQRHGVTGGRPSGRSALKARADSPKGASSDIVTSFVPEGTVLFGELVARRRARGLPEVPNRGGWYFAPAEIAAAEERLRSTVAVLPSEAGRSSRIEARDSSGVATAASAGGVVSTLALLAAARR